MKLGRHTPIHYTNPCSEAVRRAAADVRRDLEKVLAEDHPESSIRLRLDPSLGAEEFVISASDTTLECAGGGDLGLIYALYEVSERYLEVAPLWFWLEVEPPARRDVVIPPGEIIRSGTPVFRYRGWFLNDEDLLHHWSPCPRSGISEWAYERVFEALLRCRGNMVLPGTYLFADEPAWAWAARRGLAITEHHHEGLGVNVFRWPKDRPFDVLRHPELMEYAWEQTVRDKLAHGRPVIWALGQRGRGDWALEQEMPELAGRPDLQGKVLEKVIALQIEVVRRHDPNPEFVIYTWMEVAELIDAGHLKVPENVRLVWADYHGGSGRVIEADRPRAGDGVYYHLAMHGREKGHLAAWMSIDRVREEFTRYQKVGATHYMLLNVSNIRPFAVAAQIATKWCFTGVDDQAVSDTFARDLGVDAAKGAAWYESLTTCAPEFGRLPGCLVGDEGPLNATCELLHGLLRSPPPTMASILESWRGQFLPFAGKGDDADIPTMEALIEHIEAVAERLDAVVDAGRTMADSVSPRHAAAAEAQLRFQPELLASLWRMWACATRAACAHEAADTPALRAALEAVLGHAQCQHDLLQRASRGRWMGFHDGGIFSATRLPAAHARRVLDTLDGLSATDGDWGLFAWNAYEIFHLLKSYQGDRTIELPSHQTQQSPGSNPNPPPG